MSKSSAHTHAHTRSQQPPSKSRDFLRLPNTNIKATVICVALVEHYVNIWHFNGKVWSHRIESPPSSINLLLQHAGMVTVGLTSHWPCVTDSSGIPPTGSWVPTLGREMSTPPTLLWGMAPFLQIDTRKSTAKKSHSQLCTEETATTNLVVNHTWWFLTDSGYLFLSRWKTRFRIVRPSAAVVGSAHPAGHELFYHWPHDERSTRPKQHCSSSDTDIQYIQ